MKLKIFVIISVLILYSLVSYNETIYKREATIVSVKGGEYTALDTTNNIWDFSGYPLDYKVNDKVTLVMHNNHTDNIITDDIIKKVVKNGTQ